MGKRRYILGLNHHRITSRQSCTKNETLEEALAEIKQLVESTGSVPDELVQDIERRFGVKMKVNDRRKEDSHELTDGSMQQQSTVDNNVVDPVEELPGIRSPGKKLTLQFTCDFRGCELPPDANRTEKKIISENSYENGVVLARCKCQKFHLIADNLGWFGESAWNVENILAEKMMDGQTDQDLIDVEAAPV